MLKQELINFTSLKEILMKNSAGTMSEAQTLADLKTKGTTFNQNCIW